MTRRTATQIYTVFGQCEAAAAEHLINAGKATKITLDQFPRSVERVNSLGHPAQFAVVVPSKHVAEFEELCRDLRA